MTHAVRGFVFIIIGTIVLSVEGNSNAEDYGHDNDK